jgi:hypothetical protein
MDTPDWAAPRWNWPFYVDQQIEDLWGELPAEAKMLVAIYALEDSASDEPVEID